MTSLIIVLVSFLGLFTIQLILVRLFEKIHFHPFLSFSVYVLGLPVVIYILLVQGVLFITSLLIYLLLCSLLLTFSFVPLLKQTSPASFIATMLRISPATKKELESDFDEGNMIYSRLDDLVKTGLIQKENNRYIVSSKGELIAKLAAFLCKVNGLSRLH